MPRAMVLLVDDDVLSREVLGIELKDAGFEIVEAFDGNHAMAELNADPGRFRAVITDINLGTGPDGWDVGRRVRELVPGMPVVYLSGESSKDWPNRGVPCSLMLAKPFPPAQLVVAIVSLTGTPPPGLSDRDPRT